jgi:hypothetical protein
LRRVLDEQIKAGAMPPCARCGEPVLPGQRWDLDHTDDRLGWLGPSHASCNRATAGQRRSAPEVPLDDPERSIYYRYDGERWSRPWFDWRKDGTYERVLEEWRRRQDGES